ncbi:MAG: hypothetical protein RLZ14_1161, partial [Actinomycetota bacterium]
METPPPPPPPMIPPPGYEGFGGPEMAKSHSRATASLVLG